MCRGPRIFSDGMTVILAFVVLAAAPNVGFSQVDSFTVTGTVVDQRNGSPLQYAVVVCRGNGYGTCPTKPVTSPPHRRNASAARSHKSSRTSY